MDMLPQVGEVLAVKASNGIVRGHVTVESVDYVSGTVTLTKPVPAGTSPGDAVERLPEEELKGLKRA